VLSAMPNRKRKQVVSVAPKALKSRRVARQRTTHFHALMGAQATAAERGNETLVAELGTAIAENREAYQHASIVSTSHFKSSKWVFQQLTALDRRPKKRCPPLRLLEVGAINTQLAEGPGWLDVTAIDLESRHPLIVAMDFFELLPEARFDAVVLSMVLNCVPTPEARGDMLRRCRAHLRAQGLLFLMIPLLCVTNSSYTTEALLLELLQTVGFSLAARRDTPRIAFFCLQRQEGLGETAEESADLPAAAAAAEAAAAPAAGAGAGGRGKGGGLRVVRKGRKRNNFAVVLEAQPEWMRGGSGGGRALPSAASEEEGEEGEDDEESSEDGDM